MKNSAIDGRKDRWRGRQQWEAGGHAEGGREGLDQGGGRHRPSDLGLTACSVLSAAQTILQFRCFSITSCFVAPVA